MIQRTSPLLLALALSLGACSQEAESPAGGVWQPLERTALDAGQQAQLEQATAAKGAMMGSLMGALSGGLADKGPAGAIGICKERAPAIAQEVGAELGLTIGRTSHKLRNPSNSAPAWAQALLESSPAEQRFSSSDDGRLGVAFPIVLQPPCIACHGAATDLAPDVREALASGYPEDQATGYAVGDLRGWFWVEVPAATN